MEKTKGFGDSVIELTNNASSSQQSNQSFNHNTVPNNAPLPTTAWPQEPVALVPDKNSSLLLNLFDAVLLFVPFVLFAKVGLVIGAWYIDRNHRGVDLDLVSKLTLFLLEFNDQMVTAFTIIFVTIMSTLVRRYALWKAQEGAYVPELEQLQGSISLPSTFKLIISLRAFTLTSVALVSVWSFYYLGSQASKREFEQVSSAKFHKMVGYTGGPDYLSGLNPAFVSDPDSQPFSIKRVDSDFWFAMAWSDQVQQPNRWGTDSAGSALIPDLNALLRTGYYLEPGNWDIHIPTPGRHGWVDVSKQSLIQQFYSSYTGRQVWFQKPKLVTNGQHDYQVNSFLGDYTVTTSYLDVGCSAPNLLPFESFPNGTYLSQGISMNMTKPRDDAPRDSQSQPLREFELWIRWPAINDIPTAGSSQQICNISSVNVDMKVHCQELGCYPRQLRYASNQSPENATSYKTPFDDDAFAAKFFSELLLADGVQGSISVVTQMTEVLSAYSTTLASIQSSGEYNIDSARAFNKTLTQYFNTYYILSQQNTYVNPIWGAPGFQPVTVDGALYDPHYGISWPWIAVDIVSCAILLAASIIACWLRRKTLAPDIFGYVSSLTRDNQYLQVPDNGTTLGGIERARLLKGVKVKIGDVSGPDEPVGRVGLAQVGSGVPVQVTNLRPTTTYI
ncbi:hypothetical protein LTR84_003328 [Exophiala bonariae]|uniref:Uncharacterized protein n=1 Tax=Exophiala bonariae TaxID=1690606 RepID=A0AAV9NAP4_9EURO|nr:hypothetical protein LTR84_003328 [Exophiala bonariae]